MIVNYKIVYANGGIASRYRHSITFPIKQTVALDQAQTLANMDALAAGVASMLKASAVVLRVVVSNAYNDNGTKAAKSLPRSKSYNIAGGRAVAAAPGGSPAGTTTVLPENNALVLQRNTTLGVNGRGLLRFAVDTGDVIIGADGQFKITAAARAALETALAAFSAPSSGTFVIPHAKGGTPRNVESLGVGGVVDSDATRKRVKADVKLAKAAEQEVGGLWSKFQDLLDDYANGGITYDVVQTAYTAITGEVGILLGALPLAARLALHTTSHPQLPPPPSS